MAYDPELADRIRTVITNDPETVDLLTERKMFGGLGFMINGKMAVAAGNGGAMMLRIDPQTGEGLIDGVNIVPQEMRGKSMTGWLHFEAVALTEDADLDRYVRLGVAYARSLPAKQK